jgi:cyclophilin family peptidyl-prolyl cis-trans isomerase
MRRLLLLLAFAAMAAGPARGHAAVERPETVLELSAAKAKVTVGEEIRLRVVLTRKKGRPIEIHALRFGRDSVSLRVQAGGAVHTLTRIYGEITEKPGTTEQVLEPVPAPPQMLVRGTPQTLDLPVLAVRAGPVTFQAVYRGLPEELGVIESSTVEIEVLPAASGRTLGAVVETTEGTIGLELWPDRAMNTVTEFLSLAKEGFYDGLTFHRVLPGYLVQGGDPNGNGTGGPGYYLPDEPDPDAKHVKGVVSLARIPGIPDTGGSQFFLLLRDDPRLDGRYTAFGRVVEGMDVLAKLAARPVETGKDGERSRPKEAPEILSIRPVIR